MADAGVIVRVWDGDKLIGSTVANNRGQWSLDIELGEGEHSLVVDSISKGGTVSEKTDPFKLVIDSNILPAPVVDEMVANNGDEERVLQPGDSTNDTTPVLRGEGNDGDIIYVIVDGEKSRWLQLSLKMVNGKLNCQSWRKVHTILN